MEKIIVLGDGDFTLEVASIEIAGGIVNVSRSTDGEKKEVSMESGYWEQDPKKSLHRPGWFVHSTGCLLRGSAATDDEIDAWYEEFELLQATKPSARSRHASL